MFNTKFFLFQPDNLHIFRFGFFFQLLLCVMIISKINGSMKRRREELWWLNMYTWKCFKCKKKKRNVVTDLIWIHVEIKINRSVCECECLHTAFLNIQEKLNAQRQYCTDTNTTNGTRKTKSKIINKKKFCANTVKRNNTMAFIEWFYPEPCGTVSKLFHKFFFNWISIV